MGIGEGGEEEEEEDSTKFNNAVRFGVTTYLLVIQDPRACITAVEQKFSEAINSIPVRCL